MQKTQRSLRILLVTNNYTPYTGGVSNSLQITMQALHALGHKPLLVTLDFKGRTFEADVIRLFCPIRFNYFGNPLAMPLGIHTQLKYIIEHYHPDVVHVQHPFLLGPAACAIARTFSIPTIFTYHTQYHEHTHYVPLPTKIVASLVARHVRNFCNVCDVIVMPTHAIHNVCRNWLRVSTHIIPSGIDERYYQYLPKEVSKPIQLLTVGRMVPEKRVTILLDAISMLDQKDYRLTLIGYGYQYEYLQHYAYQIKKLSPEQVQFIHQPSKEVMADWYAKAHLFLFAAPHDTQGLVLAEAMAAGTPVLALPGPGQQEIIQDGYNGFIVPSVDEMVVRIKRLSEQPSLYAHLQEGARQTAQTYRPNVGTQRLIELYRSLL